MAKKKKKWKSRIKKALKLAAIGGAGYLAAKAFGGKKGPVSTAGQPVGVNRMSTNTPPILGTDQYPKASVDNVAANTGVDHRFDTRFSKPRSELISKAARSQALQAAANAPKGIYPPGMVRVPRTGIHPRAGNVYKKGGSVTGIAKRGFGRALMKGKK